MCSPVVFRLHRAASHLQIRRFQGMEVLMQELPGARLDFPGHTRPQHLIGAARKRAASKLDTLTATATSGRRHADVYTLVF